MRNTQREISTKNTGGKEIGGRVGLGITGRAFSNESPKSELAAKEK